MSRRSSSPKQDLTTSTTQLTTIKKEEVEVDEKSFKLDLNLGKSFNVPINIPTSNNSTSTASQNSMSNGTTKAPPNHPIPTSFHHLLASGPLFATMPSHSTNQNPNIQQAAAAAAAFNPASAMLAALGALNNPQQQPDAAALHAFFGGGAGPPGMPHFGVYPSPSLRPELMGPIPGYFLDSQRGFHPYSMEAGRRKNATREVTLPLKKWLNEHRKNPYPSKAEKTLLALVTQMSMTQVSTWFANARRRLKKENKMTWSPRNRTAEDDDDDDENVGDAEEDEDDEDLLETSNNINGRNEQRTERPSSSVSILSDDSKRIPLHHHFPQHVNEHYSQHQQLLQSMANQQAMFSAAVDEQALKNESNKNENRSSSESQQRKKIWSIAETLNQARRYKTSASPSPHNSPDEFKDTKAVDLSSALNTSSSSTSLSPPQQIPAAVASRVGLTGPGLNSADYAHQLAMALTSASAPTSESTATTSSSNILPTQTTPHQQQTPNVFPPGGQFPFGNFAQILAAFSTAGQGQSTQQRLPIPQMPPQFNGAFPPQFLVQLFAQQHQQQHQQHLAAVMMNQMLNASQNGALRAPVSNATSQPGQLPPSFLMSSMAAMAAVSSTAAAASNSSVNGITTNTNNNQNGRNVSSSASSEASAISTRPPSSNLIAEVNQSVQKNPNPEGGSFCQVNKVEKHDIEEGCEDANPIIENGEAKSFLFNCRKRRNSELSSGNSPQPPSKNAAVAL